MPLNPYPSFILSSDQAAKLREEIRRRLGYAVTTAKGLNFGVLYDDLEDICVLIRALALLDPS